MGETIKAITEEVQQKKGILLSLKDWKAVLQEIMQENSQHGLEMKTAKSLNRKYVLVHLVPASA